MNMSTFNSFLKMTPKSFDPVGVVNTPDILLRAMLNRPVLVPFTGKVSVGVPFVCGDRASLLNVLFNDRKQIFLFNVLDHLSHDLSAALNHTHNNSLFGVLSIKPLFSPILFFSTNPSFVNFNVPGKRFVPIDFTHVSSDLMSDPPSTLIRY